MGAYWQETVRVNRRVRTGKRGRTGEWADSIHMARERAEAVSTPCALQPLRASSLPARDRASLRSTDSPRAHESAPAAYSPPRPTVCGPSVCQLCLSHWRRRTFEVRTRKQRDMSRRVAAGYSGGLRLPECTRAGALSLGGGVVEPLKQLLLDLPRVVRHDDRSLHSVRVCPTAAQPTAPAGRAPT